MQGAQSHCMGADAVAFRLTTSEAAPEAEAPEAPAEAPDLPESGTAETSGTAGRRSSKNATKAPRRREERGSGRRQDSQ